MHSGLGEVFIIEKHAVMLSQNQLATSSQHAWPSHLNIDLKSYFLRVDVDFRNRFFWDTSFTQKGRKGCDPTLF